MTEILPSGASCPAGLLLSQCPRTRPPPHPRCYTGPCVCHFPLSQFSAVFVCAHRDGGWDRFHCFTENNTPLDVSHHSLFLNESQTACGRWTGWNLGRLKSEWAEESVWETLVSTQTYFIICYCFMIVTTPTSIVLGCTLSTQLWSVL